MSVVTARYTFSGGGEDFGPRKGRRLVVLHTFENADPLKNTMRDAIAGATWQDRNDVLGAYNRLIAIDGVLGCVPDDHISGGMLAGGHPDYSPRAWLYDLLPAYVVNDGNSYALQLCAMGRRAWYDANGWPASIIDGYARSIIEEEQAAGPLVVANHADFQPGTRSDAGVIALDLVMKRYAELTASPEPSMIAVPTTTYPQGSTITFEIGTTYDLFNINETTGAVTRRKYAGSGARFPALGRVRLDGDADHEAIAYRRPDGGTSFVSGWGPQPVVVPPPDVVAAALADFNANLDTWIGQRPRK